MGLTIHYSMKFDADSPMRARQLIERLRQAAIDLPMAEVGEVREFLLERVHDEGRYWENRDAKALAETAGAWNSQLAALVGQIKDGLRGHIIAAPITEYPNFEHLEAEGRKAEEEDSPG